MAQLGLDDFARLFGTSAAALPPAARTLIEAGDFRYAPLEGEPRDRLILSLLEALDRPELAAAGPARQAAWERGWRENLAAFEVDGRVEALIPRYFKPDLPVRLEGRYVVPADPHFYRHYTDVFRRWVFPRFFAQVPTIYEFGCGSGSHVACLAELFADKRVVGLDWADASQRILACLARVKRYRVEGRHFDFFAPDRSLTLDAGCGVLTFGALEQVGERFGPFIDYLRAQRPAICLHIEGFVELYEPQDLFDYLAARYHRRRGYLEGLLPHLQQLERAGELEILATHRHRAGVFSNDTYSYVAWRAKEAN